MLAAHSVCLYSGWRNGTQTERVEEAEDVEEEEDFAVGVTQEISHLNKVLDAMDRAGESDSEYCETDLEIDEFGCVCKGAECLRCAVTCVLIALHTAQLDRCAQHAHPTAFTRYPT